MSEGLPPPPPPTPGNGWSQYQYYVIEALKDIKTDIAANRTRIGNLETEVTMLKVKSGVWGAIAGLIPVVMVLLAVFLGGR